VPEPVGGTLWGCVSTVCIGQSVSWARATGGHSVQSYEAAALVADDVKAALTALGDMIRETGPWTPPGPTVGRPQSQRDRGHARPVEGDVVELDPIFVRSGDRLNRADGHPPHAERFSWAGYDVARVLADADDRDEQEGRGLMGALLGFMLGVGMLLVWQWRGGPAERRSPLVSPRSRTMTADGNRSARPQCDIPNIALPPRRDVQVVCLTECIL
jgi:hypothetical protein